MANTSREATDGSGPDFDALDPRRAELRSVRRCLFANPSDQAALILAGDLLYEMGRFEESAAHLAKAMSCSKCPLYEANARTAHQTPAGDPLYQDPIDAHCSILTQLADCYAASSEGKLAERYYRAASALSPTEAVPHVGLGALALQAGQLERAQRFFETARDLQPSCDEAYSGLAMIYQKRLDHSAAFDMYLKCLELDTDNLVALLGLFQTSCQMGTFAKIIYYLEAYLTKNPADTSVLFCLATLYAREGRLREARGATLKILAHEPDKEGAAELLAELDDVLTGANG